jgi:epoxyqueuosine reductase
MSMSSLQENLNGNLTQWSINQGFSHWGASSLENPISLEFYRQWIEQNYHGEMEYLKRHLPLKENPKLINERLESALIFAHPYVPHPKPLKSESETLSSLRKAFYAKGEDYHFWLKEKLEVIAARLREQFPHEVFLCLSDSSPILERDLAYRAGLGWVGKNTCLIDPQHGSFFLIGEIVTSLHLESTLKTAPDFCGTCTRCMDVCPTKAIEAPRLLNAQKCISYLTIESRELPPPELRAGIGDWFFGCDLCQTVCPWNEKAFRKEIHIWPRPPLETAHRRELSESARQDLIHELREILTLSGKKIEKKYHGSPLKRAGPFGLRRNAIIVATNHDLHELKPEISNWERDEKLRELVHWSLSGLSRER